MNPANWINMNTWTPAATAEAAGPMAAVVTQALDVVTAVGVVTLVLGIVLCLYRVLRGPHLADRVLAADLLSLQVVGLVILLSIQLHSTAFIDVALVVNILGFASTLAFAQYIGARAYSKVRS